jgi:hypothetical protein
MNRFFKILGILLITTSIDALSLPLQAGQYQYCFRVQKYRTVRDSGNHPTAYNDGYREGQQAARNSSKYEPRSAGGEFARGFDDGYYGRPATGQQYTIPNRQEPYLTSECQTYFYNDNDSIDQILGDVLRDFEQDIKRQYNIED